MSTNKTSAKHTPAQQSSREPVHTIRLGAVTAKIWIADDDYEADVGYLTTFELINPRERKSTCFSAMDAQSFAFGDLGQVSLAASAAALWIQQQDDA